MQHNDDDFKKGQEMGEKDAEEMEKSDESGDNTTGDDDEGEEEGM